MVGCPRLVRNLLFTTVFGLRPGRPDRGRFLWVTEGALVCQYHWYQQWAWQWLFPFVVVCPLLLPCQVAVHSCLRLDIHGARFSQVQFLSACCDEGRVMRPRPSQLSQAHDDGARGATDSAPRPFQAHQSLLSSPRLVPQTASAYATRGSILHV